jgi:hypothetical protein
MSTAPTATRSCDLKMRLGIVGWLATLHTDGMSLGDVLSDGEKLRHRFPGFAGIVLIEAGDDTHATLRLLVRDADQFVVERLEWTAAREMHSF